MDSKLIKTEADYQAALRAVSALFDKQPEPGTPECERFEILTTLIESYEARHYPVDLPDTVEAIKQA